MPSAASSVAVVTVEHRVQQPQRVVGLLVPHRVERVAAEPHDGR